MRYDDFNVCVFITAVPNTKLCAWGEGDSGGHVLRETTSRSLCGLVCPSHTSDGTREEPGTLTQSGALFSPVPFVWESDPKLQGGWCKPNHQPIGGSDPNHQGTCVFITPVPITKCVCFITVCVFYYCRTYYKAVRVCVY